MEFFFENFFFLKSPLNCQKVPIFQHFWKFFFLKSNLGLRKSFLNQTTYVLKNRLYQQSFLNQAFLNRDSTVWQLKFLNFIIGHEKNSGRLLKGIKMTQYYWNNYFYSPEESWNAYKHALFPVWNVLLIWSTLLLLPLSGTHTLLVQAHSVDSSPKMCSFKHCCKSFAPH